MGKLKINDKVIVKETGKIGVVKGRDIISLENNKVRIEYIVKTDNGFDNWNAYSKSELEKVKNVPNQKKIPSFITNAKNGYMVTVVAIINNETIFKDSFDDDGYYRPYQKKGKHLRIGYAIFNPSDNYDHNIGINIAMHRAKNSPFCNILSDFSGEFNKETVMALLKVKGEYIADNIDKFIKGTK